MSTKAPEKTESSRTASSSAPSKAGKPAHEIAYQEIKKRILYGEFSPGRPVTLQGIADDLKLSLTPIRESVRRLIAERALEFHGNRRISVPEMSYERLEEIYAIRLLLEPELAFRAAGHTTSKKTDELEEIDSRLDDAIAAGDVRKYLEYNFQFHETLYNLKHSEVFFPVVESLWLQFGPSLRVVSGRYGASGFSDQHKRVISGLRNNDPEAVRMAVREDIDQGLKLITEKLS